MRPGSDAMRLPNRSGAPPEAGEVAWNTYLKRRVSNHDTHRGDALKASAVLPTMWYRKWELFPAAGPVVRPYIREVVSNRVYHLIPDYGGHKFSTSDRHACGIKSANFQKKEVFCISSKGFNQRDAYRVMLRKYPDVMNIEQMCDALRISTKTGYKLLHEGKIPAMKIGRSYRIPKAHLFTYLQICGQHCRAENRQC